MRSRRQLAQSGTTTSALCTKWISGSKAAGLDPGTGLKSVGLQRALDRIDQLGVPHSVMGVQRQLDLTVFALGGRRQDFAYPIGNHLTKR